MAKINNKNLIAYSCLAFSISFIGLPIYIYLPNYYINNFNIGLKEMGLILLFTRFIDALQDPIFGIVSDKYLSKKKLLIVLLSPFLGLSFFLPNCCALRRAPRLPACTHARALARARTTDERTTRRAVRMRG